MTILASEVKLYRSAVVTDDGTNGGGLSITESVSNVSENIFPDVPQSERIAGSIKYRKMFVKVENDADEILYNTLIFLNRVTPGDDWISVFAGTQSDVQSGISGAEDHYGVGTLNADVLAAATSVDVAVENAIVGDGGADIIFRVGDTIRITDKATLLGGGNEEFRIIDSISWVGNVATLGFADGLTNGYTTASNTSVSSGCPIGDIDGVASNYVVTTAGNGTYDELGAEILVDHIGGVADSWTVTFTSATAYDVSGTATGSVGSGNITTPFSPTNGDFSKPYFTIPAGGFVNTWATSDTLTFDTVPAARSVWYKRNVPAGAAAISGNFIDTIINGENV